MLKSITQKWRQVLRLAEHVRYKVVAINPDSQLVTVYCRGRGATFKQPLCELVKDNTLLDHLPVSHLAWLGYSLSKYGSGEGVHYLTRRPCESAELSLLQWQRRGLLTFLDKSRNETVTASAYSLIQSNCIARFSRVEAFYIGIQAGNYDQSIKRGSPKMAAPAPSLVMIQGGKA